MSATGIHRIVRDHGGWDSGKTVVAICDGSNVAADWFLHACLAEHPFSFDAPYFYVETPDGEQIEHAKLEKWIQDNRTMK